MPTRKTPRGDALTVLMGPDRTESIVEYQAAWYLQDGGDSGLPISETVSTDRKFMQKY